MTLKIKTKTKLFIIIGLISSFSAYTHGYNDNINRINNITIIQQNGKKTESKSNIFGDKAIKNSQIKHIDTEKIELKEIDKIEKVSELKKELKKRKKIHKLLVEEYNNDLQNNDYIPLLQKSFKDIEKIKERKREIIEDIIVLKNNN